MKPYLCILATLFLLSATDSGQELSREQKFQEIVDLNSRLSVLEEEFLQPAPADLKQAEANMVKVFRLMPRERFGRSMTVQEGGACYSFTTLSHDYQQIAQIMLYNNDLMTGFAGADYGLISDVGTMPLSDVTQEIPTAGFLMEYAPPTLLSEIRKEQSKSHKYETDFGAFSSRVPVGLGHTYVLRAISFDNADVLVALKVVRKDTDGSLIINWKLMKNFQKPTIVRDKVEN